MRLECPDRLPQDRCSLMQWKHSLRQLRKQVSLFGSCTLCVQGSAQSNSCGNMSAFFAQGELDSALRCQQLWKQHLLLL